MLHQERKFPGDVLQRRAEEMIVDRHEANGELFKALFEKPGFQMH